MDKDKLKDKFEQEVSLEFHELTMLAGMVSGQLLSLNGDDPVNAVHLELLRNLNKKLFTAMINLDDKLKKQGGSNGR